MSLDIFIANSNTFLNVKYNSSMTHLQLALCRRNKLEFLLERPLGLYTDPLDEVLAGRNIMDQADDLASSPDLITRISMFSPNM